MVDKMAKQAIIPSARLLNIRFGKEPDTGALFHSIVNQTEYFGFKAIRLITSLLFNGLAASNSNRCSNWADGFLLIQYETRPNGAGNSERPLPQKKGALSTMGTQTIPPIPQDGQDFTHLSEAELSALLDLVQSQIEFHRDELTRLRPMLHRLQAQIPNSPFADFINDLQEI